MNQPRKVLPLIVTLIFIVVAGYCLWSAFAAAVSWITTQDAQIATATIAFAGTVIVGIVTVVIGQQHSKSRELAEAHRPKKTELYNEFITKMIGMLRMYKGEDSKAVEGDKDIEEFFYAFTTDVVLWGSSDVLRHYARFRSAGRDHNPTIILIVDDVMQAMRKDLGLSNRGLSRGDLMKMFLTDPEKLETLLAKSSGK